jgi:hypothetical protein
MNSKHITTYKAFPCIGKTFFTFAIMFNNIVPPKPTHIQINAKHPVNVTFFNLL